MRQIISQLLFYNTLKQEMHGNVNSDVWYFMYEVTDAIADEGDTPILSAVWEGIENETG